MPKKPSRAYGPRSDSRSSANTSDNTIMPNPSEPIVPWQRPAAISDAAVPGVVTRAYGKFFDVRLRDEPRSLLSTVKGSSDVSAKRPIWSRSATASGLSMSAKKKGKSKRLSQELES